jgi:hypothetical protein
LRFSSGFCCCLSARKPEENRYRPDPEGEELREYGLRGRRYA